MHTNQFGQNRFESLETRCLLSAVTWSPGVDLPVGRGGGGAVSLGTQILLLGGKEPSNTPSTVYESSDADGAWVKAPSLEQGRTGAGVGVTYGGVFLFGGNLGSQPTATAYNYSPLPDGDSRNAASMNFARSTFAYTADPISGDLYAIGGLGTGNVPLASVERYDPTTNSWSPIAPLPQAIYASSAASDGLGHVFVIGGIHSATAAPLSSVYRYTIATDSWDLVAAMETGLRAASAVAAPDGKIYVIGGISAAGTVANVESYNPALNEWSDETPLASPVSGAAVTVDSDNNLYVIGGFNQSGTPTSAVSLTQITPGVLAPYTPTISIDNNWYTYDGTAHSVTATVVGTDGITPVDRDVTFTYNGSNEMPTAAGDYKVIATFTSADPDYLSTVAAGDLFIAQATPKLTLSGGGTIKYDGQPHAATASQVGIDGVTPVDGKLTITYNGDATPPVTNGTYNVVATFTSADPNYSDVTATTTITIPDPTIPTGVTAIGASTTSIQLSWDAIPVPVAGYNIYERHVLHDPKGSGATITYPLIASNIQRTSATISVAAAFAGSAGHTYYVSSVSPTGVVSPRSAGTSGQALYAPTLYGALLGGAVVSSANVQVGQSVQITLLAYGNQSPAFSLVSGPATMSVDPVTGVVTYSPAAGEVGDVTATFKGTNSVGSSTETFVFHVLPPPSIATVAVNVAGVGTAALTTTADGLRLLPTGRTTDLPWAGIDSLAITLSASATLRAADVSVIGSSGIDYGPVVVTGSGATYNITFARPINSADRVTIQIANAGLTPFVRRVDVLPGDISDDGQVDFSDMVVIAQNFGKAGTLAQRDLTGDGQIDFADLVIAAQSYGSSLPADGPLPAVAQLQAQAAALPTTDGTVASGQAKRKASTFSTARVKVAPVAAPISARHSEKKRMLHRS